MRVEFVLITLVLALAGCAGDAEQTERSVPRASTKPPAASALIVGHWERVTTCEQRVKALQEAGLGEFAVEHAAGEGWIPGVTDPSQIKDSQHPCEGAVPLKHGHYFTEGGEFGSTDDKGEVVDDGTYRAIGEDTIVVHKEFGDVTFAYRVRGDSLFLDPVMPKCSKSGCFKAQWAVAVAYPGLSWKRVDP
jgi:hypothetical protein